MRLSPYPRQGSRSVSPRSRCRGCLRYLTGLIFQRNRALETEKDWALDACALRAQSLPGRPAGERGLLRRVVDGEHVVVGERRVVELHLVDVAGHELFDHVTRVLVAADDGRGGVAGERPADVVGLD